MAKRDAATFSLVATFLMAMWSGCGTPRRTPVDNGNAGGPAPSPACPSGSGGATGSVLTGVTAISAGPSRTCALMGDGTVSCWGLDADGFDHSKTSLLPVPVRGLSSTSAISLGVGHACAVQADGTVMCWGSNSWGQLGHEAVADANGGTGSTQYDGPVSVQGLANVISISAGVTHSCAVLGDTTARCWGSNKFGQLGNGSTASDGLPVTVSGLSGATAVSAGISHSCALVADGTVQCWGANFGGQLGDGSRATSNLPVSVTGLSGAVGVIAGFSQSCAIMGDGGVRCWGMNDAGEQAPAPEPLGSVSQVSSLSTALDGNGGFHSCVAAGGVVQCWGENTHGQFGNGFKAGSQEPIAACGVTNARTVSTTSQHTCALLSDQTVACWGRNSFGELGNGATTEVLTPALVRAF